jgi:hypothetical protein
MDLLELQEANQRLSYYQKNKEHIKLRNKIYYQLNKDIIQEKAKIRNKEYRKKKNKNPFTFEIIRKPIIVSFD